MAIINTDVIQRSINSILWLKRNNRPQYIPSTGVIEALAELADCELQRRNEGGTTSADTLLDTIGRLHARNKSLQKGHATLTRRVQELEAQLEAQLDEAQSGLCENSVEMTCIDGTKTTVCLAGPISHADTQLQQDLAALQKRVNGLEDAGIYAFTNAGKGKHAATAVLEDAITRGISAARRPGGVLHNALKNG